jgi:hypothetical protein
MGLSANARRLAGHEPDFAFQFPCDNVRREKHFLGSNGECRLAVKVSSKRLCSRPPAKGPVSVNCAFRG